MIWYFRRRNYKKRFGERGVELIDMIQTGKDVRVTFENLKDPVFVNKETFPIFHHIYIELKYYGDWSF